MVHKIGEEVVQYIYTEKMETNMIDGGYKFQWNLEKMYFVDRKIIFK